MQFQVPQFIEVEDKIFGPLTFKQFVYLAGGAGMGYIFWRLLPIYLAAPIIAGVFGLGAALAFFKYNGRPFILALEHGFFFFTRSKLYLWSNEQRKLSKEAVEESLAPGTPQVYVPKLSESRLHELSWSLDIKERIAAGTADDDERAGASPMRDIVAPVRTARDALIN
jgi:hypothetical protein